MILEVVILILLTLFLYGYYQFALRVLWYRIFTHKHNWAGQGDHWFYDYDGKHHSDFNLSSWICWKCKRKVLTRALCLGGEEPDESDNFYTTIIPLRKCI